MRNLITNWPFRRSVHAATSHVAALVALVALTMAATSREQARADETEPKPAINSAKAVCDPFGPVEVDANDPFETELSDTPVHADAYVAKRSPSESKQTNYQETTLESEQPATSPPRAAAASVKDPCGAAQFKPLSELGISIAQPEGQSPTDFATPCWNQINTGPNGAFRCWPRLCYQWDATCLCYNPLYFEEVNAERYGYICDDCCKYCCSPQDCWQSAASAAHFFGTIPCLPYCLVAECPTECVYTLGHYRPGTCGTPWRRNYPPCDPVAAVSAGGIYTGLIFAIP